MKIRSFAVGWMLILPAVSLLGGCGDLLKQPYPAKSYFGISPGSPSAVIQSATQPSNSTLVLIHPVHVIPPYDQLSLIYRTGPSRYQSDYYNNWIASPATMLTGALNDWLDRTGPLRTAFNGSSARSDFVLDTEVTQMLIDRTDASHPHATLTARFFLMREMMNGSVPVLDQSYSSDIAASPDTPDGDVMAIGQAYREILQKLQHAIAELPVNRK